MAELNQAAQTSPARGGEVVRPLRRVMLVDGVEVLVDDEVHTRQNDRSLTTEAGVSVKHRHRWIVDEVGADGSVAVSDEECGRVAFRRAYAAEALILAYGSTAMAAQGRPPRTSTRWRTCCA